MGDTAASQCSPCKDSSPHSSCALAAIPSPKGNEDHASSPETLDDREQPDSENNVITLTSNEGSDDIYDRFSAGRKRAIVAVVSFAALLARG